MTRERGWTVILLDIDLRGELSQHFLLRLVGVTCSFSVKMGTVSGDVATTYMIREFHSTSVSSN